MKKIDNFSHFLHPALILLAMLAMSGNAWADGTVTTAGGATWTYGTEQGTSVWYWDGGTQYNTRNMANWASEMSDAANYDGHGFYTITPDNNNNEIAHVQANKESNRFRVVMQNIQYSISVPAYTSAKCTYDLYGYVAETNGAMNQYKKIELFDWGTSSLTLYQVLNTANESNLSGNNSSDNKQHRVLGASRKTSTSSSSAQAATDNANVSWTLSNATGSVSANKTEYFAMHAMGSKGTYNRGWNAYLKYTSESITYTYYTTVTFHANGGSGSMTAQEITATSTTATTPLSANAYTRSGYAFAGWNTAADGSGTMYADKADFLAYNSSTNGGRGPVTLYAIWVPYYSVSFHANGGTGTMSNIPYIAMDQAFEIPANGFTAPTYTITFDANGGEAVSPIAKTLDFNGWEDHGDIVGSDGHTYTYDEYDGAYYANKNLDVLRVMGKWIYDKSAILSHYIGWGKKEGRQPLNPDGTRGTYLAGEKTNGGETVMVHQLKGLTTTPGYTVPLYAQWVGTITLPTPSHTGDYFFDGWYDGETRVGGAGDTYAPVANQTLVAHWTKYTYFYETNGGTWDETAKWKIGTGSDPAQHQAAVALPTDVSDVVVSKTLIIDTEEACYSLTIMGEGSVTIAPTGGLSVGAGGVTGATASNFRIQSSTTHQAYFRMSPSAITPMPTATVEYATKGTLDTGADKDATWQYFGVPVTVNNYTCDNITWLNQYDAERGWISLRDGQAHTLEPWIGYTITQYGQPVYEWSGQLINGDKNITLATQGMNHLIANSYSAPIDVTKFTGTDFLGNLDLTFYIYNAGSWNNWNTNKGTDPSQSDHAPGTYTAIPVLAAEYLEGEQTLIAPMQAIMVRNMGTDPVTIRFNYAKHVWAAEANHGSSMTDPIRAPHRATANPADELTARVRLSVGSANSGVDHLYMLEKPDFTGDYDNGYDAPKMATRGLVNLYTTVQDGMLAVDAKDQLENTYVGFAAGSDSEYSLHFSAVLGTEYYLLDQQTGICTQMAEGAHYDFSATPNSIDDYRFIILRQSPGISTTLPNVSNSESPVTEIYTISGLRMDLPQSKLPKGIYIIRQGQTVNKIAIQ